MLADSMLTCRDCEQSFVFTVREQEYYASHGFDNPPGRCPDCRTARKAQRGEGTRGEREMFETTCTSCGKPAQVPFRPSGDRPVYCAECYPNHRGSTSRGRGR